MGTVRYAAKAIDEIRDRELEATGAEIWSEAITVTYLTDPEIVAAVLPKPLEPGPTPRVRLTITTVTMPGGRPFGAGWFGVQARHGDVVGEYPLFMPMTTEQATIGGRETYGEPKKIGEVWATKQGDRVSGGLSRLGFDLAEVNGRIVEERAPYELNKTDFYFKFGRSPQTATMLDRDALLVYGEKTEKARVHLGIEGNVVLKDSPLDPIADLVIREVLDINWTERASIQTGRIVATVPGDWLVPFAHQRYDDMSVLGAKKEA